MKPFILAMIAVSGLLAVPDHSIAAARAEKIDELMVRYWENGQVNGTILVAEHGHVIYEKAFGYANFEWRTLNTLDTRFRIASMTKPFTALLVLQLVEEGRMSLEARISDYLPDYPAKTGRAVTIHHLLSHTSGIIDYGEVEGDFDDIERMFHSRQRLMGYFANRDLLFEPGTRWRYSNFGYNLLAVILERVTGKPYSELLQERIFRPAGMKESGTDDNTSIVPRRASGYHHRFLAGPINAPALDMSVVVGSGDMYSTVRDLYLFDQALHSGKLLSRTSMEKMFTPVLSSTYGYGWMNETVTLGTSDRSVLTFQHGGAINGFKSNMHHFVEDGHFIVQLSNYREVPDSHMVLAWTDEIAGNIAAILYDEAYTLPRRSAAYEVGLALKESGIEAGRSRLEDLEKSPDSYRFELPEFVYLGSALIGSRLQEAAEVFRMSAGLFPSEALAHAALGAVYSISGEGERAEASFRTVTRLGLDTEEQLKSFGYRLLDAEHPKEAAQVFELIAESFPESSNAHYRLGMAYLAAGDKEKASISLNRALELDPDSPHAKQALSRLRGDL